MALAGPSRLEPEVNPTIGGGSERRYSTSSISIRRPDEHGHAGCRDRGQDDLDEDFGIAGLFEAMNVSGEDSRARMHDDGDDADAEEAESDALALLNTAVERRVELAVYVSVRTVWMTSGAHQRLSNSSLTGTPHKLSQAEVSIPLVVACPRRSAIFGPNPSPTFLHGMYPIFHPGGSCHSFPPLMWQPRPRLHCLHRTHCWDGHPRTVWAPLRYGMHRLSLRGRVKGRIPIPSTLL